ncbi:MarR family winged helix-turn-helix transcriptional regulator [Actinomadura viridis]|uniref:MarR family winged helix-turn-helix transcriptional regulator n=1 Tax=Actinomadura viridis TaxID=58110 RepID=UPI0036B58991
MIEQHSAGESAGFLLWHANLRWQRTMAEVLAPLGLTHVQFVVLTTVWWLGRDGRPPRQRDVAEHGGLDPAMTSQVTNALVGKRWIVRSQDPADARASLLHLTDQGRDLAEEAVVALDQADRSFFEVAGDRPQLIKLLRKIADRDERGGRSHN